MATLPQRWLTGTPARRLGGSLLALIFVLSFFALILDGHHYSSPFEVDPALWADGGPQPVPVTPTFPVGPSPKRWGMKVSNVVHYVMLARPDGSTEMDYRQYLAIRHYDVLPTGTWWDLLKPHLTLNQVVAPDTVWGQRIDLAAHKSDVLRLYALREMGGVYLDLDVFVLRSMDDLFYYPFTMGLEEDNYTKMGNAVVMAEPHAPFIERWLVGYQDFRKHIYEYNGVIKPLEIAEAHPDELRLLNSTAFFFPQWWLLDDVFKSTKFDWDTHPGYTYHAWGSLHKNLNDLNPEKVLSVETSFHRLLRRFMGDRDMENWLHSKEV